MDLMADEKLLYQVNLRLTETEFKKLEALATDDTRSLAQMARIMFLPVLDARWKALSTQPDEPPKPKSRKPR